MIPTMVTEVTIRAISVTLGSIGLQLLSAHSNDRLVYHRMFVIYISEFVIFSLLVSVMLMEGAHTGQPLRINPGVLKFGPKIIFRPLIKRHILPP